MGFTVLSAIAFVSFALSLHIKLVGGTNAAILWGFFWFGVMDFTLNGIQAPLRALVIDIVPSAQQATANGYLGLWGGAGQTCGYLLGDILTCTS